MTPRNPAELVEALASIQHQIWADWQKDLQENIGFDDPVTGTALIIPTDHVHRFQRLSRTPYANLPESVQQATRDQVMRSLPVFVEFVSRWLAGHPDADGDALVELWDAEMTWSR